MLCFLLKCSANMDGLKFKKKKICMLSLYANFLLHIEKSMAKYGHKFQSRDDIQPALLNTGNIPHILKSM